MTAYADGHWQILDEMLPVRMPWEKRPITYRLHWLLPDWEWKLENSDQGITIRLNSPHGPVILHLEGTGGDVLSLDLVRAGGMIHASGPSGQKPLVGMTIRGWASPTYGVKVPALSLAIETKSANDVQFISEFIFPI